MVQHAVEQAVERLLVHEPAVLAGHDPIAVHQARVATRRLRSDLRTFRRFLDRQQVETTRTELRWLGRELGAVRDAEVLTGRVRAHAAALPADVQLPLDAIFARLERRWIEARAELLVAMHSARYDALLARLLGWRDRPPLRGRAARDARAVLPPLIERPWRELARAVAALHEESGDGELHAVRILAKRARYAAEAVAPVGGKSMHRLAKRITDVQDVLGEHQDAVVAQHWLAKTAADSPADVAYAAGMLAAVEHRGALDARSAFPRAWERARAAHRAVT